MPRTKFVAAKSVSLFALVMLALSSVVGAGGFGGFAYQTISGSLPTSPNTVLLADLNGDDALDIVFVCVGSSSPVFLNDGNGLFVHASSISHSTLNHGVAGDFTGDGVTDVVIAGRSSTTASETTVRLYPGVGNGTFSAPIEYEGPSGFTSGPIYVVEGDWNNDGMLDFAVARTVSMRVYTNNGDQTFSVAFHALPQGNNWETRTIAVGDLDGDGHDDIIVGGGATNVSSNPVRIFVNDGVGVFSPIDMVSDWSTADIALGDVTGDGLIDIVRARQANFSSGLFISVWRNNGNLSFSGIATLASDPNRPDAVALTDIDGDGDLDIVSGWNGGANFRYSLNPGNGVFTTLEAPAGTPTTPGGFQVAVGDLDGNQSPDVVISFNTTLARAAFNLTDIVPPTPFSLVLPPDDAEGLALPESVSAWTNTGAALSWTAAQSFSVTYDAVIATDADLKNIVAQAADLTTTRFVVPDGALQHGQRYYWNVVARNQAGETLADNGVFTFQTRCAADIDGSGVIDFADFSNLLSVYGNTCPD